MRRAIRFELNGAPVTLAGVDPRTTLLDWLREERRLTGTKEGCNEGDCGACTVAVTRLENGAPRRRAVNACIQLLPMLDGAAITTVEAVAGPDRLHPAQAAMVERHASQCGFCTPGFVMSLWAAFPEGPLARPALAEALAGNLCRCTGYGPIMAAGRAMHDLAPPDWEEDPAPLLAALADEEEASIEGGGAVAHLPASEDALAGLLEDMPEALLVAGATDVGLWITKRLEQPREMIFLNRIKGFDRVIETPEGVELGAAASYAQARPALARLAPDLGRLMGRIGSAQVRACGTVGGNIANGSPIGDMPPPLIALGAEIELRRGAATRTLPLEDFFLAYGRQDRAPGEFLSAVRIPRPADPGRLRCWKISKRFEQDISAVLGAFHIVVEGGAVRAARIAFGGMAETPKRARAAEAALTGAPWTEASVRAAMDALAADFSPISDMRASAAYRLRTAQNLLLKYFLEDSLPIRKTRVLPDGEAE